MSDQLLRYAEFAGIPVYKNFREKWTNDGEKLPCIVYAGEIPVFFPDEHGSVEWTLSTYLGRMVIADALENSKNWPMTWCVRPPDKSKGTKWRVVNFYTALEYGSNGIQSEGETRIDAVLAAVEEVGK